jgi:hypothetical protein
MMGFTVRASVGAVVMAAGVYLMRMARVNITVPDDVITQARAAGLNVSRVATAALVDELDRLAKIAALDTYLAELEVTLGPATANEVEDAQRWADRILTRPTAPAPRGRHSA